MYEIETPELPAGHVAQVIQAGYMLGERVLRPAMVAVSKSGPKSQASAKDHSGDAA
jgi:molecular chaperone GrpE